VNLAANCCKGGNNLLRVNVIEGGGIAQTHVTGEPIPARNPFLRTNQGNMRLKSTLKNLTTLVLNGVYHLLF
jgi:hypothetical protein